MRDAITPLWFALVWIWIVCSASINRAEETHPASPTLLPPSESNDLEVGEVIPAAAPANSEKVHHLQQAAEHLEAAGLGQQAQMIRQRARKLRLRDLLADKRAQLAALQVEIDRLEELVGHSQNQQIVLHATVMKISVDKLQKLGYGREGEHRILQLIAHAGNQVQENNGAHSIVEQTKSLVAWVDYLREHQLVEVVAQPTVATVSGRPATYASGTRQAVICLCENGTKEIGLQPFGLRLDFTAEVVGEGKIRLDCRCRQTQRVCPAPCSEPLAHSRQVVFDGTSSVEIAAGQSLVQYCAPRDGQPTSGLLVLATPQLVPLSQASLGWSQRPLDQAAGGVGQ